MRSTNSVTIKKWKQLYSRDQENLYKNLLVRTIFDLGHKYISSRLEKRNGVILDLGSGVGYHLKFEKIGQNRTYICLDKDRTMLDKIKGSPSIKKIVGSCEQIPLISRSADSVIASHILEHVPNLDIAIREIKRVMKRDAILVVVLPCDPGWVWNFLTCFSPSRYRLKRLGLDYNEVMRHEHVNSYNTCLSKLKENFDLKDERYYPFVFKTHHLNIICGLTFGR